MSNLCPPDDSAAVDILDWKNSARLATTAALPANTLAANQLTGVANGAFAAVDGIVLALNESILVKNEVAGAKNGLFTLTQVGDGTMPYILTRRSDANSSAEVTSGMTVPIEEGTINTSTAWTLTTIMPIVLNTTALVFQSLFSIQDLANVLTVGNVTGGTDIEISDGDDILPVTDGNPSIGSDALRFLEGFIDQVLVGGAVDADADATANDVIVGDGTAVARGMTFVGTNISDMSIVYSDGTLLRRAEIRLENSATPDRWVVRTANVDRLVIGTMHLSPFTNLGLDLGTTALRWSRAFIEGPVWGIEPNAAAITAAAERVIVITADAGTGAVVVTLPAAAAGIDYILIVTDITNTITITRAAGDTINGAAANPNIGAGGPGGAGVGRYYLTSLDGTDWRLHGPLAEV